MSSSSSSDNSSMSAAGTCSTNTTSTSRPTNDPIAHILQGLHFMQNELQSIRRGQEEAARVLRQNQEELQSVCQGQEETARMVRESQMEFAQTIRKGKKPAYTFRKKGNEIQSAFIDQVVEKVTSAASRIGR